MRDRITTFWILCAMLVVAAARTDIEEAKATNQTHDHHKMPWQQCKWEQKHGAAGWVMLYIIGVAILFIGLAIICDDFFVPSLEAISEKLNLSEDVAGATFMAAGSSAPELFTSVAGVAIETDVGVGTIVGSAVFNILVIIAVTGAFAGQVLFLDWRPLVRDSVFYAFSITAFVICAWDGELHIWETIILLSLYAVYIVIMKFNPQLMTMLGSWNWCCFNHMAVTPQEVMVSTKDRPSTVKENGHENNIPTDDAEVGPSSDNLRVDHRPSVFHHTKRGSVAGIFIQSRPSLQEDGIQTQSELSIKEVREDGDSKLNICPCLPCCPGIRATLPERNESGCGAVCTYALKMVLFIFSFPFICLFTWTIPDCSQAHNRKWYWISFIMSVLWIAALSFGMVIMAEKVGCILNVDAYTMGLVVIAIGTSIPDMISSVLVARDGFGDMAVSNAIGSNVFDINLGLGLPYFIRICIQEFEPIKLLEPVEKRLMDNGDLLITPHVKFGFILMGILLLTFICFTLARFRLGKVLAVTFISMYISFLVYAFVQELHCKKLC